MNHNPHTILQALQDMTAELSVPAHFMPIGLTNSPDEGTDNPVEYHKIVQSNPPGTALNEQIAAAFPDSYAEVSRILGKEGMEGPA